MIGSHQAFPDESAGGLTKREWLIGMAMAGILANPRTFEERLKPDEVAEGACNEADAVMRRLTKK